MSADLTLPDTFDVIVCGTGLTESMVAASLSRIGKKVLHVDRYDYYGGHWATFTFESLDKWIKRYQNYESNSDASLNPNAVPPGDVCITNICVRSYIHEKTPIQSVSSSDTTEKNDENSGVESSSDTGKQVISVDDTPDAEDCEKNEENTSEAAKSEVEVDEMTLKSGCDEKSSTNSFEDGDKSVENFLERNSLKPLSMVSQARIRQNSDDISLEDFIILSRKFNLDITTKFLFSAGPLVNAIIKANISHYAEFKVVNRILTWKDDQIMEVPCNRADVFGSSFLTMIEKRMLMKFLTQCLELSSETSEEISAFNGKPFKEFLESRKLSENLRKFVIYSIALVKPDTPTEVALSATHKFLKSLGRYGKSPFIWPLYGIGELPQAFCRMSAVFGGTYCLKVDVETIEVIEDNKIKVCINGQNISSDHLVMEGSYVPYRYDAKSSGKMVSRGILITNQSLLPTAEEHLSFLTIPPLLGHEESVRVIEVGPASSACPSGLFVLYLTCASSYSTAEEDLLQYTTLLVARNDEDGNKPKLLWSLYYNQLEDIIFDDVPENVFVPSLPDSSLGFDLAVEEAERIFHAICPGEEFMLAVPNSEDIIWGTGNDEEKTENVENANEDNSNNKDGFSNLEQKSDDTVCFMEGVTDINTSEKTNDDNGNIKESSTDLINPVKTSDAGISDDESSPFSIDLKNENNDSISITEPVTDSNLEQRLDPITIREDALDTAKSSTNLSHE